MFSRPIFMSSDFVKHSGIPRPTAQRFARILVDKGLLSIVRKSSGRQSAILAFTELLNIAEGKPAF